MNWLERLRHLISDQPFDALLISAAEGRRYLSGFTGSAGYLLVSPTAAILISDGRYTTQAAEQAPGWEFRLIVPPRLPLAGLLHTLLPELGVRRLGFEPAHLTVAQFDELRAGLGDDIALVASTAPTDGLRASKDAEELALLERAVAITDAAFASVRPLLRPAMREREAAWEIEKALRAHGADGNAFEVIVAAGPNSSKPHARPTDEPLGWGRPVIMDFGALVAGYHGDMTRTVILGAADEQFWTI